MTELRSRIAKRLAETDRLEGLTLSKLMEQMAGEAIIECHRELQALRDRGHMRPDFKSGIDAAMDALIPPDDEPPRDGDDYADRAEWASRLDRSRP